MSIMIDLSFLIAPQHLWDKKIIDKLDFSIKSFRESKMEESDEECFLTFCLDFQGAKSDFINKLRDLSMLMKCRTKADTNSNFGGQQCASFVDTIKTISDKYLNSSIYFKETSALSIPYMIKGLRKKAEEDKPYALEFEEKTKMTYLSTGKDNTLEIFNNSGWRDIL